MATQPEGSRAGCVAGSFWLKARTAGAWLCCHSLASPQGPGPSHLLRLLILFILWAFILVGQLHGSLEDPHQALLGRLGGLQALDRGKAWRPVGTQSGGGANTMMVETQVPPP